MKESKIGRNKGRIFLDGNDFSILKYVSQNEGINVMSLVSLVGIKHQNFKNHFEKLLEFDLIRIEKEKQVKKIFFTYKGELILQIFNISPTSQTSPIGDFSKPEYYRQFQKPPR